MKKLRKLFRHFGEADMKDAASTAIMVPVPIMV